MTKAREGNRYDHIFYWKKGDTKAKLNFKFHLN